MHQELSTERSEVHPNSEQEMGLLKLIRDDRLSIHRTSHRPPPSRPCKLGRISYQCRASSLTHFWPLSTSPLVPRHVSIACSSTDSTFRQCVVSRAIAQPACVMDTATEQQSAPAQCLVLSVFRVYTSHCHIRWQHSSQTRAIRQADGNTTAGVQHQPAELRRGGVVGQRAA